jgi:hypothetical protein
MAVLSRKQVESGQVQEPVRASIQETAIALPELPEPVAQKKKPKPDDQWYILGHPDVTESSQISAAFEIDIDGDSFQIELERGRVETQFKAVKDELVRRGYRYLNEEF